jgi:hypothetical protein
MKKESSDCCKTKKEYKGDSPLIGLVYGIIPHIGCIIFVISAILGATILMQFFRPFLMNRYIFHYLILISFLFATISSFFYLKKSNSLSFDGIRKRRKHLTIMYGSTIGINLLLFFFVFPYMANITGSVSSQEIQGLAVLKIKSDIPCPGHAPLISSELKKISGVKGSEYSFPNNFNVYYDALETSPNEILSLEVFEEYPAEVLIDESSSNSEISETKNSESCSGGCGGTGSCGGGCGSPTCTYNQ